MATNTPNFSLPKPDANDNFNRAAYNTLIDAIDTKVGAKTTAADTHMADLIKHITAGERDKWNASQLFALTSSTGSGKTPTNNDLNATITVGFYNVQASNLNSNSSSGTMFVSTQGSSGISQIFHTTANKLFTRFSGDTGATWSTWVEQETAIGAQAKVDAHATDAVKHITAPERDKWNGGQLFKLTQDNGHPNLITDFNATTTTGLYRSQGKINGSPLGDAIDFYAHVIVTNYAGEITQIAHEVATELIYTRSYYVGKWSSWRKVVQTTFLANVLLGNKFVDQSNANFVGKVTGSTTANPHIVKGTPSNHATIFANALESPSSGKIYEVAQGDYYKLSTLDNSNTGVTSTVNTAISQQLFSFNLIEHVQRTYGTIPGATTADKVAWLKSNLSKLTFNWFGFGSSPAGNKATVSVWNAQTSTWSAMGNHTQSSVFRTQGAYSGGGIANLIDSNGFFHGLAYADASDGTTDSVINTDYVELNVELSTDIKSSLANATQSTAGLQSGADKAKLDGISTGANKTTNPAINGSIAIDGVNTVVYAHPTGDGNSHVPATGTTNGGKVLKAGGTANALSWAFVDWSEIINKPSTYLPSAHNHAISDVTGLSTALSNKLDTSQRGAASGVASLGADGKVPTSQLPTIANTAADITIADSGNYFDGANVETGMQEIGRVLAGSRASLVASAQQLGVI